MGTDITAIITIDSSSTFDLEVKATDEGVDVNCKKEAYKISGN